MTLKRLVHAILDDYALPWHGTHGVGHWARVLENGLRLAEQTGADAQVVRLFALFHDARRVNEGVDPGHGRRGGALAAAMHGEFFTLPGDRLDLLVAACEGHTDGKTEADVTIQTCWDADRLDLGRVGIRPDPALLCTAAAAELIPWADRRARCEALPDWVRSEWGIDPAQRFFE